MILRHACRDYTNPYLPVAPAHADPNMLALGIQAPLATSGNPMEGNVLLCQVNSPTLAVLGMVLSLPHCWYTAL